MFASQKFSLSTGLECERCGENYTCYCVEYHKRFCNDCYSLTHPEWQEGHKYHTHHYLCGTVDKKIVKQDISKEMYIEKLAQKYKNKCKELEFEELPIEFTVLNENNEYFIIASKKSLSEEFTATTAVNDDDDDDDNEEKEEEDDDDVNEDTKKPSSSQSPCDPDYVCDCDLNATVVCIDCLKYFCDDCFKNVHSLYRSKVKEHVIRSTDFSDHFTLSPQQYTVIVNQIKDTADNLGIDLNEEDSETEDINFPI